MHLSRVFFIFIHILCILLYIVERFPSCPAILPQFASCGKILHIKFCTAKRAVIVYKMDGVSNSTHMSRAFSYVLSDFMVVLQNGIYPISR